MSSAADTKSANAAVADVESAHVVDCRRLIDLLVSAAVQLEDREWKSLSPGMYGQLASVEPLAILREIALNVTPDYSEKVRLGIAS